MTEPPEPLDLSLLARVSGGSTFQEDKPPTIPGGESDGYREVPTAGREEPTRPRSAGPTRPRSTRRTRASVENERPPPGTSSGQTKPEPRSIVRDDTPTYHPGALVKPLTDLYVVIGTAAFPFSQRIGTTFVENAKGCAEAWDQAARVDKNIRRVLMQLVGVSVWGPLAAAHAPIGTAIIIELMPRLKAAPLPMTTNGQPG